MNVGRATTDTGITGKNPIDSNRWIKLLADFEADVAALRAEGKTNG
jgi:hypothetical protein